jgi:hypothetical protein
MDGVKERIVRGVGRINRWLKEAFEHDGDGLVGFEY